jgi:predicted amidophosphoribosyltransferase
VVEAWKREQGVPSAVGHSSTVVSGGEDRAARVYALGESGSLEHVPELISALADSNGNVRRLAASALGKLRAVSGVEPLLKLLASESGPQVRQYAIKALGAIGDERARPVLERLSNDSAEMEYNRLSAKAALRQLHQQKGVGSSQPTAQPSNRPTDDPVAAFLSRPHPRPLTGPWLAGWALDFNSRFSGADYSRSEVGELVYLYKYRGERHLARELAARWMDLIAAHSEWPRPDAVIPIPPSIRREFDPVTLLAQALAERLSAPALIEVLVKTRATSPQKDMTSLAQKQANVAGAFALKGDVRGKRLILVDDLYDSGATLEEAARVLARGGAHSLIVLALTKTIHADA